MVTRDVSIIDSTLVQTAAELDLLLAVTPTNSAAALDAFKDSNFKDEPVFEYRASAIDRSSTIEALNELPIDDIEDPTVASLLAGKRAELISQIQLVDSIDTPHFRELSIELYGDVDDELYKAAEALISELPRTRGTRSPVSPTEMAQRAEAEFARYRAHDPGLASRVEVRDDLVDLMVSRGNLFIGSASMFRSERVEALIQHEVGTHVVTYHNGSQQPLLILCAGLAGYEETQEGLALLAEYIVGGLDPMRMRVLAARVIAVKRLLDGATFSDIFCELRDRLGFSEFSAWGITARVSRSGGLTKDAMYLRGLTDLVRYLRDGGSLPPLLVGKIALGHVPHVQELLERGVLVPPALTPSWLDHPEFSQRLERVRRLEGLIGLLASEVTR